ncbi:MAG: HEAT repeat domain-containing protein [Phycisphaerales bacterium]|jgi:hypothetical protein|nr:HEAT repeat domain-containing protein [Phycisphaerales bacterium]
MMILSLRKVSACLLAAVFLGSVGGCTPPWESDEVVLNIAPVNYARIRQDAEITLRQAAEDDLATTRFVAMEAIPKVLGAKAGPICKQALSDKSPEVRFAAAMGIGEIRYAPALEKLQTMAKYKVPGAERDAGTYCAVIYALHQLGDQTHTSDLGEMLFDDVVPVRASAALVMGKMKLKAAIQPLKSALGNERDDAMKFELTRALARCGEKSSIRKLEAYTRDRFVDEQIIAIRALEELQSPMCRTLFPYLAVHDKSPRVRTVASGALAAMGYETPELFSYCAQAALEPRTLMVQALGDAQKVTNKQVYFLQSLAAMSMSGFKHQQAIDVAGELLKSKDPGVRVASAVCILKKIPDVSVPKPVKKPVKTELLTLPKPKPEPVRVKLHTAGGKD